MGLSGAKWRIQNVCAPQREHTRVWGCVCVFDENLVHDLQNVCAFCNLYIGHILSWVYLTIGSCMTAIFMSLCNSHDYERLYFQKSIIENCFIEPYV